MQVSLENTTPLERRMTVSLPAERFDGGDGHIVVGMDLDETFHRAFTRSFRGSRTRRQQRTQHFGRIAMLRQSAG
jgi:trigger factor